VFSVARRAKTIFESSEPAQKREFLNFILQNPTVNGKNLEYSLRSPFNLVLEMNHRPSWGPFPSLIPILDLFSDREYMTEVKEKLQYVGSFG